MFPYKTYSEILTLVMVTLLKELVHDEKGYNYLCINNFLQLYLYFIDLPTTFVKEIQEFVRVLFLSGQAELATKQQQQQNDHHNIRKSSLNTFKLTMLSNAIYIELLVWAAADELAADSLCTRLTEKINSSHGHKLVMAHLPLLFVCLDGLGELSQRFPSISDVCIASLRDFLVTPSPILSKLHRQQFESQSRSAPLSITISTETTTHCIKTNTSAEINTALDVCEQLRHRAIEALCISLRAGLEDDQHCIQAFIASVSNRLYQAEKSDSESSLVATNTIVALGRIAVNLVDTPRSMDCILQFFQQRFCRPASPLDNLIVEQLGEMIICKNRDVS